MKNVLIIYTGGTIGMTRTENGYAPQSGQFRRAMEAIPDLYAEQMPRWDMLEMDPLLDSSNMTVHEWNKIAQAMPTFLFCSQMSFTASSVSTRPVDGGAICPFGSVCPGRMALR